MILLSANEFAMNEGFGIIKDLNEDRFVISDNEVTDLGVDNFNEDQDEDSIRETEGDEQEHWQIESMTIDVLYSMSMLVKQGLHELYLVDNDGNIKHNKFGMRLRVDRRVATNSILRWTQGAATLEDMVNKLSKHTDDHPWLKKLIERLSDKTGKESDFQSQFFGVFCKDFQLYSMVLRNPDGTYRSMLANDHPVLIEAIKTIGSKIKMDESLLVSSKGKVNLSNLKILREYSKKLNDYNWESQRRATRNGMSVERVDDDIINDLSTDLKKVCNILGYDIDDKIPIELFSFFNIRKMATGLRFVVKGMDDLIKDQENGKFHKKTYNPMAFKGEYSIRSAMAQFFTPITKLLGDAAPNSFIDGVSGKMYQNYITPSYLSKLFRKFHLERDAFNNFIMEEYAQSEFFYDKKTKTFRCPWLNELVHGDRGSFIHKVSLSFDKHGYMRKMSPSEYTLSMITEYFSELRLDVNGISYGWFRVPMMSNKPSSEYIKFPCYPRFGSEYKKEITKGLHDIFLQELDRIQTVKARNLSEGDAGFIKNYDERGRQFCFLDFLNPYLNNDETSRAGRTYLLKEDGTIDTEANNLLAAAIQKRAEGIELSGEELNALATSEGKNKSLIDKVIYSYMEERTNNIIENWEKNGIVEAAQNIENMIPDEFKDRNIAEEKRDWCIENLKNFLWNDYFAAQNILELTVGDTAFYKDTEDLQKRLAQLHAPGIRPNVDAVDYNGKKVSDGRYRTIVLKDFDNFISSVIDNISEVFDRKKENAPESQKQQWEALKNFLVGEDGVYRKINVADAQAYSSPSSYRKKAYMFGKWSKEAEDIYQRLKKGDYTLTDLKTVFQPLKPFVYAHVSKDLGVEKAPIHTMMCPFQAKNAEYLLVMADALTRNEDTTKPNLLKAVFDVMEDTEKENPTKGIDTVQFESAVKSSLQGQIDITQYRDKVGGEASAYDYMMNKIYNEGTDVNGKKTYNTKEYVHECSYENYCLQQEVPEHFKDHSQAQGSQERMIIPSDLDFYKDPKGNHSDENNIVYYEWKDPKGNTVKLNAHEFRKEYENTIAENIQESVNNLSNKLSLDPTSFRVLDKKKNNVAVSEMLLDEIMSSSRYGADMITACDLDDNGNFIIPKGDPIQSKRIEQMINSIIKNRINKQKIAGGPIVQVSNYGTSRQLHIRFNDKNGYLIPTEEEFNKAKKEGTLTDEQKKYSSYQDYIHENQGGIAYFEVFAPIWSDELVEKFGDEEGNIDIKAIEAVDPQLLMMVSSRIPTEDKYSIAPMKVVGFLPHIAGEAIMFPYDLTAIDGSDFDVDKRYVMMKNYRIVEDKRKIHDYLFKKVKDEYKSINKKDLKKTDKELFKTISDQIYTYLNNRSEEDQKYFSDNEKKLEQFYQELHDDKKELKYMYKAIYPSKGRAYRDNKIIDMTLAVLTNETSADKILNPGGFEPEKKTGYRIAAYKKLASTGITWEQLGNLDAKPLRKLYYTEKNLAWADTQIQFYRQNSAAASLIGMFAIEKIAHAIYEGDGLQIDINEICKPFKIAGMSFNGRMLVDPRSDSTGNMIGKVLGSLVGASADAAKDPILNLMNINMTTVKSLNTLIRLGMPFDDAALFLSQKVVCDVIDEYYRANMTGHKSLDKIIDERLEDISKRKGFTDKSSINNEEITKDELIDGLLDKGNQANDKENEAHEYKVLLAFKKLRQISDEMSKLTFLSRFNSISSAVGPLIIDNLIIELKMDQFNNVYTQAGTHFYSKEGNPIDIKDIFERHPVLKKFASTVDMARAMFSDMPVGSTQFREILDGFGEKLSDKIYRNRKTLDKLANFYQSYLLIQSGAIDGNQVKRYVDGFPKWFLNQKFGEQKGYADNALIKAIQSDISKTTGRPYLYINLTGLKERDRSILESAFIDLYKKDKKLAEMLITYNFFRGGIGFSPKTFNQLVSPYIKKKLFSDRKTSYVDTYTKMPEVDAETVRDQFIRNNWDDNTLVPIMGAKKVKRYDIQGNTLKVISDVDKEELKDTPWIKTKNNWEYALWKYVGNDSYNNLVYEGQKPLGDNGEYLEMYLSEKNNAIHNTTALRDREDDNPDITQKDNMDIDHAEESKDPDNDKKAQDIVDFLEGIKKTNEKYSTTEKANEQFERMKEKPRLYANYMVTVFSKIGLNVDKEEALKRFNKLC